MDLCMKETDTAGKLYNVGLFHTQSGPRMSLVIKLHGLSTEASSLDIRHFFSGLNIPKGYIYITGGQYGEAFIIFANYEDARQAINYSGRPLKNSCVQLSFSSEAEMQQALDEISRRYNAANPASTNGTPIYKETGYFKKRDTSYIYVHGMPLNTTKVEIKPFFAGLSVEDVIFLKYPSGLRNGNAIVRFATSGDAHEALKRSGHLMGSTPVSLMLSDETEWTKAGGTRARKRESSPVTSSDDRKKSVSHSRHEQSRARARSPYEERFVHLINLPYDVNKRDIKAHFGNLAMKDSQITFLRDWSGKRTREGFVKLTSLSQYRDACAQHGRVFCSRLVDVLPISERDMLDLIARSEKKPGRDRSSRKDSPKKCSQESHSSRGKCIYLRNFASDVSKTDIQSFFSGFSLKEEDIFLLYDDNGIGLGEALVLFSTEKEAESTKKLHCKKFQGTEILISCINEQQMKAFGVDASARKSEAKIQERAPDEVRAPASESQQSVTEVGGLFNLQCEHLDLPANLQSSKIPVAHENLQSTELPFTSGSTNFPKQSDFAQHAPYTAEDTPSIAKDVPFIQTHISNESLPESSVKDAIPINNGNQDGVGLVLVRNLPRTFTVSEALDFFHGYKVSSVNLAQIDNGIARVRFQTNMEAVEAVKELNNKPVGHTKVSMTII